MLLVPESTGKAAGLGWRGGLGERQGVRLRVRAAVIRGGQDELDAELREIPSEVGDSAYPRRGDWGTERLEDAETWVDGDRSGGAEMVGGLNDGGEASTDCCRSAMAVQGPAGGGGRAASALSPMLVTSGSHGRETG